MHHKRKTYTSHQWHTNLPLNVNFVSELTTEQKKCQHQWALNSCTIIKDTKKPTTKKIISPHKIIKSSKKSFGENAWIFIYCHTHTRPTLSEKFLRFVVNEMRRRSGKKIPRLPPYANFHGEQYERGKNDTPKHSTRVQTRKQQFLAFDYIFASWASFRTSIVGTSVTTTEEIDERKKSKAFNKQNEKRKTNKILQWFFYQNATNGARKITRTSTTRALDIFTNAYVCIVKWLIKL